MFLADQVDLDVADVAARSQIILANQPVKVDRGGGAGVDLVVADFRDGFNRFRERVKQLRCRLDGRALRRVDDNLELGLVVEWQHLENDELKHDQGHRYCDQGA